MVDREADQIAGHYPHLGYWPYRCRSDALADPRVQARPFRADEDVKGIGWKDKITIQKITIQKVGR